MIKFGARLIDGNHFNGHGNSLRGIRFSVCHGYVVGLTFPVTKS